MLRCIAATDFDVTVSVYQGGPVVPENDYPWWSAKPLSIQFTQPSLRAPSTKTSIISSDPQCVAVWRAAPATCDLPRHQHRTLIISLILNASSRIVMHYGISSG